MSRYCVQALILSALAFASLLNAGVCNSTDCTFTFDTKNNSGSFSPMADYGTVRLRLASGEITFTIDLADTFFLINTNGLGAGAFGFNQSVAGLSTFTYSNFAWGSTVGSLGTSPAGLYASGVDGGGSNACSPVNASHFDGFGCFTHSAASTAPKAGNGSGSQNVLQFTVSKGGGFGSIFDLVAAANPAGGDASPIYFTADVWQSSPCAGSCTGLVGVGQIPSSIPEPASYATLMAMAFVAIVFIVERRAKARQSE